MLAAVIRSFADPETERFYTTGKSRRIPKNIRARAARRLTQIHAAARVEDLRLPQSNMLEASSDREGQWNVRIDDRWRIGLRFDAGDVFDVEIADLG